MKAVTVREPFASLIAVGAKRIETRSWKTPYRGPIAIHAAKGFTGAEWKATWGDDADPAFRRALEAHGIDGRDDLKLGHIIAVGLLVASEDADRLLRAGTERGKLPFNEGRFGFYGPGRVGWLMKSVVRLPRPVPAIGQLGLWNVTPDTMPVLQAQVELPTWPLVPA